MLIKCMALTKEYHELLKKMHVKKPKWGRNFRDRDIPKMMKEAIETFAPKSILDFGCGAGVLVNKLKHLYPNINVTGWDPRFEGKMPEKVDMIISTDVLEHVEPNLVQETLVDLGKRSEICQYHLIACFKAVAILPDGRNAHLTVRTPDWWQVELKHTGMDKFKEDAYAHLVDVPDKDPLATAYYECILKK